jgi:hypothetical protein
MTLEKAIDQARFFSRTSTSGADNGKAMDMVNEAMIQFAKDVPRLSKKAYLTVVPRFSLSNTLAIRLTVVGGTNALAATDIPITDSTTELTDQTGTQVATELQERIRAAGPTTFTVTWSTTDWTFTFDTINGTSITFAEPDSVAYGDACGMFGVSGTTTEAGADVTGSMPEDCTLEASLPSDYLELLEAPAWDEIPLENHSFSEYGYPQVFGTPTGYAVSEKKMRFYPAPDKQGRLRIRYKYWPTKFATVQGYQECGLTAKTLITSTGLANTTQYYFKVRVDTGALTEYSITTVTDTTYSAIIALLNAALTTVTWSIVGGDLRCTSNTKTSLSAIALAAGTTGTNLFATLTGWSAFDTAVTNQMGDEIPFEEEWESAIIYYTAYQMSKGNFETEEMNKNLLDYQRQIQKYKLHYENSDTQIVGYREKNPVPNWHYASE